jgi:hypothetical protein
MLGRGGEGGREEGQEHNNKVEAADVSNRIHRNLKVEVASVVNLRKTYDGTKDTDLNG